MTAEHDELRHFVRHVLGCGCPDEVLQRIGRTEASLPQALPGCERIDVGGRLLIYLLRAAEHAPQPAQIRGLLNAGRQDRDRLGFNRFRLAIGTSAAEELRPTAEQALAEAAAGDEKLHVHVLETTVLPPR